MLKWTARAFAVAATLQLGLASAQDVDAAADLIPPGPAETEAGAEVEPGAEVENPAADENRPAENLRDDDAEERNVPPNKQPGPAIEPDEVQPKELPEEELPNDAAPPRDRAQDDRPQDDLPDVSDDRGAVQRESRYLPDAAAPQEDVEISERVRAATANLDIDDATRSRYRWHNGEWWFKAESGAWKYHRDGQWHAFDPTTYRAARPGILYSDGNSRGYAPQGYSSPGYVPQAGSSSGYVAPRTYSSGGYYYGSRPYTTTRRYGVYRPDYEYFDGRYYRGGYGGRVYGDGYYGRGYGYGPGYNSRTDRYYGYGPGGRYSIDGDRYRGGVIGSEIGGRIGGRSGAIIGGALGAEAAD